MTPRQAGKPLIAAAARVNAVAVIDLVRSISMRSGIGRRRAGVVGALAACVVVCAFALTSTAQAQQRHPDPQNAPKPLSRAPGWHGNIERFHEHDWQVWRGGRWQHGSHAGRIGWWWVVGGVWYFYPAPVYPYPNPWEPPPFDYVTPPVGSPPPPPPTQYWYLCESAKGYYPYVPSCPGGWKQVPATPPK